MSADDPSTWAPPGESAADLWQERSNLLGLVLSCAAYGVHLTLYLFVLQHLVNNPTRRAGAKARVSWGLVAYISCNFVLGTLGIAGEARFNQLTFIDARNYPGGPNAFVDAQYGDFVNIFGTTAYVILNWFADGLVIYRFWLIYNFNYCVGILPCILLLGSVSMGIMLLFQLTQPDANLWSKTTINFAIPYWSISTSLNILVTSLIVGKLYLIRHRTRAVLSTHHSRTYTSVAAMLVESAALYSATALVFIVTYARNNNVQNLVLPLLGQVQAIAPLLIMWRVARGQAISREAMLTSSTAMTPSKLSWRRSAASADLLDSGFSVATAPEGRRAARTQSVCLPPLTKNAGMLSSEIDYFEEPDGDGWALAVRVAEQKARGVEVVVEHQVERWATDADADAKECGPGLAV